MQTSVGAGQFHGRMDAICSNWQGMLRFLKLIAVLAAAATLSACATDLTQARSPCVREPGGWCQFTREFADKTWDYAQLANDSYADKEQFPALPGGIDLVRNSDNDSSGLAYSIFDRKQNGRLVERIIAFRGSEFSFDDWFAGNIEGKQNARGLATYRKIREELDADGFKDVPISVTGHSLGGAIAAHVALVVDGVTSYAFNQSPRFVIPAEPAMSERMAVTERGEVLGGLREFYRDAPQDTLIINCRPRGAPWKDHSIRRLAQCLTWIAAYADPRAYASVVANHIPKPWVECGNHSDPHPGPIATGAATLLAPLCYQKTKFHAKD